MAEMEAEAEQEGRPESAEKAQRNFTDPELRSMKAGDRSFIQGYNAQAAVDSSHQIIVAADLSTMASDAPLLIPMVNRMRRALGCNPPEISADAAVPLPRHSL